MGIVDGLKGVLVVVHSSMLCRDMITWINPCTHVLSVCVRIAKYTQLSVCVRIAQNTTFTHVYIPPPVCSENSSKHHF